MDIHGWSLPITVSVAISRAMAVVTLINAIAVRSDFSPKPYSHGNRAESCHYEKEDAPYAA
jgi:hypothetical protein